MYLFVFPIDDLQGVPLEFSSLQTSPKRVDFSTMSTVHFIVSTQILRAQATRAHALSQCRAVHCTVKPDAPSESMTESFKAKICRTARSNLRIFPPPGCPDVSACRVHSAQKIHAVCSSNGCAGSASESKYALRAHQMAPPGQPRTAHVDLRPVLREASPNLALRRPCGQLSRQRQSCSLQALRRILCQLLRQRQNDPVRVGGTH